MNICAIILNYFGHQDTIECVESLLGNSLEKILIVDNSNDESEERELARVFASSSIVEMLVPKKNLGFAGGVNFALSSVGPSSFDAFLLLNNDTIVPSGSVQVLAERLSAGDYDLVAPLIYHYPEVNRIWSEGNCYNRLFGLQTQRPLNFLPGNFYYLTGCCLLVKSRVLEAIGVLDESFFMYGEDVEFSFRARKQGFQFGVMPTVKIYHKVCGSSAMNSFFYECHMSRAHIKLCSKLAASETEARLALMTKVGFLLLRALYHAFRHYNLNALSGLRWAFSHYLRSGLSSSQKSLPHSSQEGSIAG